MLKFRSALVDLSVGLLFVLIAFANARVLLQNSRLVFLSFPLLITVALLVGFWRGLESRSAAVVVVVLATLPVLLLALDFFSGRNKPFIVYPIVTFAFVGAGVALARSRAAFAVLAAVALVSNLAGALAGRPFVHLVAGSRQVAEKAIPFTIHLVDGTSISSQSLRGKVVVLDFWATWCVPCQHELPQIQAVYDRMKTQPDVVFFAVDGVMTDVPGDVGDTAQRATAFFHQGSFTIPLAFDAGAVLEKAFALHGFPSLLILDRDGKVRIRHVGFIGGEDLENTLSENIADVQRAKRS